MDIMIETIKKLNKKITPVSLITFCPLPDKYGIDIKNIPHPDATDAKPINKGLFFARPTKGRKTIKQIWLISFPEYIHAISAEFTPNCFSMVDRTTVRYENVILWDIPINT